MRARVPSPSFPVDISRDEDDETKTRESFERLDPPEVESTPVPFDARPSRTLGHRVVSLHVSSVHTVRVIRLMNA